MGDLPVSGIKLVSSALARRFSTTDHQESPKKVFLDASAGIQHPGLLCDDVKLLDLSQLGACMGSSELLLMPSPVGTSRCSSLEWGSPPPVAVCDLCQPLSVTAPHLEGSSVGQDLFMISPGQLPLLRIWECGAHTL